MVLFVTAKKVLNYWSQVSHDKSPAVAASTPRTKKKVDNFKQGLAARRIQRTWKHFYQEVWKGHFIFIFAIELVVSKLCLKFELQIIGVGNVGYGNDTIVATLTLKPWRKWFNTSLFLVRNLNHPA